MAFTPDFIGAEIEIDGNTYKAILKDIQFHPVTDEILHIDFLQMIPGKRVKTEIPIKFVGAAPGVKIGGRFVRTMRRVKVKADASHITDHMVADISEMELNDTLRVKDLEDVDGIRILANPAMPIASILAPRALKEQDADEDDEDEDMDGEGEEGSGEDSQEATAESAE